MRRLPRIWASALTVCLLVPAALLAQEKPSGMDIVGNWLGTLDVQDAKLRLVFKISTNDSGALQARLDSPDQGAKDIPVKSVTFKDGVFKADVAVVRGLYEGTFDKKGEVIKGTWSQGGNSLPLNLARHSSEEAEVERKTVSVPDSLLQRYPGRYELQPGFVLTITLEDGSLMAQATGQRKIEIFPETKTRFFYKVVEAEIEFHVQGASPAQTLILYQAGREVKAKRIE